MGLFFCVLGPFIRFSMNFIHLASHRLECSTYYPIIRLSNSNIFLSSITHSKAKSLHPFPDPRQHSIPNLPLNYPRQEEYQLLAQLWESAFYHSNLPPLILILVAGLCLILFSFAIIIQPCYC